MCVIRLRFGPYSMYLRFSSLLNGQRHEHHCLCDPSPLIRLDGRDTLILFAPRSDPLCRTLSRYSLGSSLVLKIGYNRWWTNGTTGKIRRETGVELVT